MACFQIWEQASTEVGLRLSHDDSDVGETSLLIRTVSVLCVGFEENLRGHNQMNDNHLPCLKKNKLSPSSQIEPNKKEKANHGKKPKSMNLYSNKKLTNKKSELLKS
jgi:hypothetical protein